MSQIEFTNFHIDNPQHINDDYRKEKIRQCYRLLKISENASFRSIRKAFRLQIISLHPYLKAKEIYYRQFINVCLAYSLLKKLKENSPGKKRLQNELFDEWFSFEKGNALTEALSLAGMSTSEFEECMIVGYRLVISNITGITLLVSTMAIGIPVNVYLHNKINRLFFIYILIGMSTPLFYMAFKFASTRKYKASTAKVKQTRQFNSLLQ